MEIWPGQPYPLGATFDGMGVNFALFSEVAEGVDLCLFDDDGSETRLPLTETTALTWHGYVPGSKRATSTSRCSTSVFLNRERIPTAGPRGEAVSDDSFLMLLNSHFEEIDFVIPSIGEVWNLEIDTISVDESGLAREAKPGETVSVGARSVQVFRHDR